MAHQVGADAAAPRVAVDQALDLAQVDRVAAALSVAFGEAGRQPRGRVVLDLQGCDFVDGEGYRLLAQASRTSSERAVDLDVVGGRAQVVRVIAMLDRVLRGDVRRHLVPAGRPSAPAPSGRC